MSEFFRLLAVLVGIGLILFSLRPLSRIITFSLVFLTALVIQSYVQMNNSPNFALIVKQWLVSQQFSAGKQIFYQIIYLLVYLITLTLDALIIVLLFRLKRLKKYLPAFKRLLDSFLIAVGLVLIIYPYELSRLFFIFIVLGLSIIIMWLVKGVNHEKR